MPSDPRLSVRHLAKSFCLHLQGGVELSVLDDVSFDLADGECMVIRGPSGRGKSTLLRMIFGNYMAEQGQILIRHGGEVVDLAGAAPRLVLDVRRSTMGYVSQFLHCLPRVPALDIVAAPLRGLGIDPQAARDRAVQMLTYLAIPERMFEVPPATFSGGEQQRVNIARSLINEPKLILLDEPTASLDEANQDRVLELLQRQRDRGAAVLAVIHNTEVAAALADRELHIEDLRVTERTVP